MKVCKIGAATKHKGFKLFKSFKQFNRFAPFKTFEKIKGLSFHVFRNAGPAPLLGLVFEAKKRFGLCVLDYVVTSNHIHLLVKDTGPNVIRDRTWSDPTQIGIRHLPNAAEP